MIDPCDLCEEPLYCSKCGSCFYSEENIFSVVRVSAHGHKNERKEDEKAWQK